jgi:hypothetical protein
MISFSDIEDAFFYVSSDQPFMNNAVLHKNTGKTFYRSEFSGEDNFPEDVDSGAYIEIPHKNDLDLGRNLVFEFVSRFIPERQDEVYDYFRRKGAYSRYKYLLEKLNLLDTWHEFEDQRTKSVLLEWCRENGLDVE